ncbi:MAG: LuxR C-terminal-related transcriptional regulator [Spirochaetales bacterium]|nr:LuxR C-terminal-related transcriptional regulator [Spirochaetales bacterium]
MKSSDSILLLIGWIPFVTFMSTLTGMMLIGGESLFYYPWGFLFILFAPYFGRVLPYRIAGLNSLVNVLLLFLTDIFFYHYNWKIRIISGFTLSLLILFSFLVTRSNQMNMIQFHTLTKTSPKEKMENFARHYKISPREKEVLLHMLTGDPRNRIAEKLNISLHTVKSHINSIYTKCCVSSKTELFKLYESFL